MVPCQNRDRQDQVPWWCLNFPIVLHFASNITKSATIVAATDASTVAATVTPTSPKGWFKL